MPKNAYIKKKFKNYGFIFTVHDGVALKYIEHMRTKNHSDGSLLVYCRSLREFFSFSAAAGIGRLQQVDGEILERYKLNLIGRGFASCTVDTYLRTLKQFFRYLEDQGVLFIDPSLNLRSPKPERKIGYVPDIDEVKKLLAAPDVSTKLGIRDRALLETAYSTGSRLSELTALDIFSPDLNRGLLRVSGKGRKDRVVPLGKHAVFWLDRYLTDVRDRLLNGDIDEKALWIGRCGEKITRHAVEQIFRSRSDAAGLRLISPHAVRRACATHMLNNGAHPMEIQTLLGHATMKTLSQYLQLTITEIKSTHLKSRLGK